MAVALAAAGCGGGGTNPQQARVERTVQGALADIARGDGAAFCALATPAAQRQLAAVLPGRNCAGFIHLLAEQMTPAHRRSLLHARVTRVTVHGAAASVSSHDITSPDGKLRGYLSAHSVTHLQRDATGTWRISGT